MVGHIDITNLTRRPAPRGPFKEIAQTALPGWNVSLVFVGAARAKSLNKKLRNKDYVPNVLSYEVGPKSGEIIICLDVVDKEASDFSLLPSDFCAYLFIHGLMHLKGHPHGPTMDRSEERLMARFNIISNEKTPHRNRNRSRHTPHKSGGGRRSSR